MKRQDVLAEAWKTTLKSNASGDAFKAEWLKNRASALKKAGMPIPFN